MNDPYYKLLICIVCCTYVGPDEGYIVVAVDGDPEQIAYIHLEGCSDYLELLEDDDVL